MKWMNDWNDPDDPPLTKFQLEEIARQEKELARKRIEQAKKEDGALIAEVERLIKLRKDKEGKK